MADWKVVEAEKLNTQRPHRLGSCSASVHMDSVSLTNALELSSCLHFLTGEIERQMGRPGVVGARTFNPST